MAEKGKAKPSDKPAFQFVSAAHQSAALEFQPEVSKPSGPKEVRSFLLCASNSQINSPISLVLVLVLPTFAVLA